MEGDTMELRHLRYFLATAREGNMTRAAALCHVSQPALSRQLADLERDLGCELFLRGSRGVLLTDDGMLLRKRAEEIVALADRAELELRADGVLVEGDVWIGGGESRAMEVVARSTARLAKSHPNVRVHLYSGNYEDVTEHLDKGLLDFGVVVGRKAESRFESFDLPWEDRWGVLMKRDHPLAGRASVSLDDLRGERLIVSAQRHEGQDATGTGAERFTALGLSVACTYTLLYNASLLVEQGVGIAVCIDGIVPAGEGTPFTFVPIDGMESLKSRVIRKRFQPQSRACDLFLRVLRKECGV